MTPERTAERRDAAKRAAAARAVEQVESGMVVGLGTGSTAAHAVARIGELWKAGRLERIIGIPTSEATAAQARSLGLPLGDIADHPVVDVDIDGADEADPRLDLIKGAGGALLREKRVASRARRFLVVVDGSKLVDKLGTKAALPVEVRPDSHEGELELLRTLGCTPELRGGVRPYVTDNGNYIIDCRFDSGIDDAAGLAAILEARDAVQAHGLFLGMATEVIVGGEEGVRVITRR